MKILMTCLLILFIIPSFISKKSDFCEGFEDGYVEGWCYIEVNCLPPPVPPCALPRPGEKSYRDGYNRGFVQGKFDRSNQ